MEKRKDQVVVVTHTEILTCAINDMVRKWEEAKDHARKIRDKEPDFAREYLERYPWKEKLEVALQMYKIETGEDFGYEITLD